MTKDEQPLWLAARKIGITLEAYLAHRNAGELWCSGCKCWHLRTAFGFDATRNNVYTLRKRCRESEVRMRKHQIRSSDKRHTYTMQHRMLQPGQLFLDMRNQDPSIVFPTVLICSGRHPCWLYRQDISLDLCTSWWSLFLLRCADLPAMQRDVLAYRYSLDREGYHTYQQCASFFGRVASNIRSIEEAALSNLRGYIYHDRSVTFRHDWWTNGLVRLPYEPKDYYDNY